MKHLATQFLCGLGVCVSGAGLAQSVVINEVMYHPAPAVPEDTGLEWIELLNTSTNSVSLAAWRLDAGVSFTFPSDTVMPAGGYLVVAASVTNFQARYPGIVPVGDWVGRLSNGGERIRLEDAEGETVDQVDYADSGDWAERQRVPDPIRALPSWDWVAVADGGGRSMELMNSALPNSAGQNWAPSAGAGGTPGANNSIGATNIAPMILEAAHFPAVPKAGQAVTITARMVDEQPGRLLASVFFRNATATSPPPAFISMPMSDDGAHNDGSANDGLYGAVLPAQTNGSVVEFYLHASDGVNTRTWPAPALDGQPVQAANAHYQVDDNVYAGNQQILRLILTGAERQTLLTMNQNSDAQMNTTLISVDDRGAQIRYRCALRIRGAGSRGRPTKNYRLNIPSDQPWNDLTAVNLNSQYPHAAVLGAVVSQKAGLPVANTHFVQVRLNGVNLARSGAPTGGDGASWGSYALLEPFNNEWANVHLPNDPNGNVYRASSGPHTADLDYLGTNVPAYVSAGYSKTSNQAENDWDDLINLTAVLNNTPDAQYEQAVRQRLNAKEWMTYFSVLSLMEFTETALGSGEGDDYALYRGQADTRFLLLGHDYDTIFGQGDTAGNLNESIWVAADAADQPAVNRFMKFPVFARLYYEELYRLATTVFASAQLNPLMDQTLGGVVTEPTITAMKNFAATRAERVLNQIPRVIRITNSLPVSNGYPRATVPEVSLTGGANVLRTSSVQVNGLSANWIAWRGAWSIEDVPLRPGVNRVLVQAFDDAGIEVERNSVEILYDDGSVVMIPATLTTDTTWTAAGGPYVVNNSLTVLAGVTLAIQPGTTVFLGPDVTLTVANGGRLLAEGTDVQPIVFTRVPGGANWGGLVLDGSASSPETRIGYAHFAFNNNTAIHARDATVFLHHLTFGNTGEQYLSLDRASFVVQDCVFPAATSGFEPLHGSGGIKPGGRGIFLRNFFGRAMGYNDNLDFTGGNRPGPILQIINNVFAGSDDDILDLDSTDAWVEGNIFLHVHRNGSPDSASAISGGADNTERSQITIVGNHFYDVDHVANAKQGNFYAILNNTVVRQTKAGSQDPETAVVILADDGTAEGAGVYLEGNIIHDAEQLVRNRTEALVTFTNNLMNLDWNGPGGPNRKADPLLHYVPQWAETTNFTTFRSAQVFREWFGLQPGSPARGAGPNGVDLGGAIPLGASIHIEPTLALGSVPVTVRVGWRRTGDGISPAFPDGAGYTHYRWRLDDGAWSAETPADTELALTGLTPGQHRLEVSGKRDSGDYQDDPVFGSDAVVSSQTFEALESAPASVVLNEVLAANNTAFAVSGTFPDAIELLNKGGKAADLSGWGLTDEPTNKFRFVLPAGTVLEPGAFLVVLADGGLAGPGLHAGFALDQRGETVSLFSAAGELVDEVQFGIQLPDRSIGRDEAGDWTLCAPSIGSVNQPHAVSAPGVLRLNEWLANSRSVHPADFIEIHNPSSAPVLLGGLFLTDELLGWPARHRVTPLTFMGAGAHFVFIADGEEVLGADHLNFRLAAERGSIGLLDRHTNIIDCVFYGAQTADVSEGRRPSGASAIAFFSTPSPGAPNPAVSGSATVTNFSTSLLSTSAVWRYEQSGVDLTTIGWQGTNYVDAGWPQGPGVFGFDNDWQVQPYQTVLTTANNKFTFYFRTTFVMPTNPAGYRLEGAMWLDDGAVIYLNGEEATRIRMPNGEVTFTTRANNQDNAFRETVTIPAARLRQGTNLIAVEVHQTSANSGDVVWGLELNAVRSVTNAFVMGVTLNEISARNLSFTNAGGTNLADWVELYNPSEAPFDLAGLSLSDDLDRPRRWVFPAGTTLPSGSYLVVRCDPDAPASEQGEATLNTGFGLNSDEGDAVYLFDAEPRGGALLDSIVFGLQPADYALGRVPDARGAWALTLPTPGHGNIASALGSSASLIINEWLANPSGNDSDFIELYNPLPQPVDLSPLFLSDSLTNRTRSPLHPFSFIGQDAFLRLVADGDVGAGADHVNFGLRASGEFVALYSPTLELITSVAFGVQEDGVSEGRFPDGSANIVRFPGTATPGQSNLLPLDSIAISEVLTHTSAPFEDAIELANVSATAVDISGWYLSDNLSDPKRYRIPPGTVMAAGGYRVFYENQFNPRFDGRPPAFALNSSGGEELYLFSADPAGNLTGFRAGVKFGAAASELSFGRYLTSVGVDFTLLAQPTFGMDNPLSVEQFRLGTGTPNAGPLVGPVVISEIAYHPPDVVSAGITNDNVDDEFIELLNITESEVVLSDPAHPTNTWRLRDAVDYEFRPGIILGAGGRLVVVGFDPGTNDLALRSFRAKFLLPDTVAVHGPWRGRLANDGENIELYRPDVPREPGQPDAGTVPYVQVDKVKYGDTAPWPALADGIEGGIGLSLHRRIENGYGNDPVNWVAGLPTPGTASGSRPVDPPSVVSMTADHEVAPGATDTLTVTASGAGPLTYAWRRNGALIPGAMGPSLTLVNFQITNAGLYSVLVMNAGGAAAGTTRVSVRSRPVILRQPQPAVTLLGGSALFSVLAAGTDPLRYQWLKNNSPLAGANEPVFAVTNVQGTDVAGYRVSITNVYGGITSTVANLELNSVPIIVTQPRSTNVTVGANAMLTVGVAGSPPLRYQWRFNAANIVGATNASLTLLNVQLTNAGAYSVMVSNAVGSALSAPAVVTVYVPPVVSVLAADSTASEGAGDSGRFTIQRAGPLEAAVLVNFTVTGTATPGSDYNVLIGPLVIPAGSSSVSVSVTAVDDAVREGNETVILTLAASASYVMGNPSSATVTLFDNDNRPPQVALTAPPDGWQVTFPAVIALSATALDPDGSVTRVEFFNNGVTRLGQATGAPYSFTWTNPPPGLHSLTAVATDNLGSTAASVPAGVSVNAPPNVAMVSPADGATLPVGSDVTLLANAMDADGSITLVEFFENGRPLGSDATSPFTFTWNSVTGGEYFLTARATDDRGATTTSATVVIIVGTPPARFSDHFVNRGILAGFSNTIIGSTSNFTREAGEPRHDSRNGAHSGWLTWTAPASGLCLMDTFGSRFDTVLAVYTNSALANLGRVVSNDDANQDTSESQLRFNAVAGTTYQIAIDGFSTNAQGAFTFHSFLPNPYPIILEHPRSQVVTQGTTLTLSVTATGPGSLSYQWRRAGSNLAGATSALLTRPNVSAADQGAYDAVISNISGSVTSAQATVTVLTSPTITTQPADQTALRGGEALFSVRATGLTPFTYQWRLNGSPIPGATSSNLSLAGVLGRNEGYYSAVVSNPIGSVTSRDAFLGVNDGLLALRADPLLSFTNAWRYHAKGGNLGTAWRQPGYDDSGWSNGVGFFGLEPDADLYPEPLRTPFRLTGTNNASIVTFYLRTAVSMSDPRRWEGLLVTAYVDDGAVWYLNGREAGRVRLATGIPVDGVAFTNLAANLAPEGASSVLVLPLTNAVSGSNLLAVEVHQSTPGSTDVVFGMSLESLVLVTNAPVMLRPEMLPWGVGLTLQGIAGRNYAIEASTNLLDWTPIVTFTNFNTPAATFQDLDQTPRQRFYRGRLVPWRP